MTEYPTIADRLADPLFLVDGSGRVAYWNRACELAFGMSAEKVLSRRLAAPLGPISDEGLLALLSRGARDLESAFLPAVRIGRELWDVRVSPAISEDLIAVYCIPSSSCVADWARLIADSADAIWGLDDNEEITAWNRGAEEMFGYTAEEILGRSLQLLIPADLIQAREPERLRKALRELGAVRDYETRRRAKDGREVEVSLTSTIVRDGSGSIIGSSTIVRDLWQRRETERQLIESEAMVTSGQLAARVAQEIGTPLTVIGIVLENLRKSGYEKSRHEKQLDTIAEQLARIARVTRGLVDLAKPGELQLSWVRIDEVILGALELSEPSLRRGGVEVDVQIVPSPPPMRGDAGQLQQVFLNLLMNAQRASESQSVGRVRLTAQLKRGFPIEGRPLRRVLEIEVSDDGPGIDPADLPFIFSPFFSTSGGSGLGLPLTRQIIHAHGGTIEARSTPGEGATFTILIPIDSDD